MRKKKRMSQTRNLLTIEESLIPDIPVTPDNPDTPDTPDIPDTPGSAFDPNLSPTPSTGILLNNGYFDTGIRRTANTRICLECDTTNITTTLAATFFGDHTSYTNRLFLRRQNGSMMATDYDPHQLNGFVKGSNTILADCVAHEWNINGTVQPFSQKTFKDAGELFTMYLGALHVSSGMSNRATNLLIHRWTVWEGNSIIQQLVAHRDDAGIPCFRDLVTGSLFYSPTTTPPTYVG